MTHCPDDPPGVPSALTESLPERLLAPGRILSERYQIRSLLGRGGMGEVWHAHDLNCGSTWR